MAVPEDGVALSRWVGDPVATHVRLEAKTAHDARREIGVRWPDLDVSYWGYNAEGESMIGGFVRCRMMSSGRLGGKPKKPGAHTPVIFVARVPLQPEEL